MILRASGCLLRLQHDINNIVNEYSLVHCYFLNLRINNENISNSKATFGRKKFTSVTHMMPFSTKSIYRPKYLMSMKPETLKELQSLQSCQKFLLLHEHTKASTEKCISKGLRKENILTIPNLLTTSRIISTPFLGYMVTCGAFEWGLGIFVCAGFTDLLDGFIARTYTSQRTALGTALDPLADKLLVSVLTITLTTVNLIPAWLTILIVSRDVALIGAAFYIRYVSLSPPKTLSRYFDVSKPSAKLYPSTISKINTALQLSLVAFTLAAPIFQYVDHPLLQSLWYMTAITTFASGLGYLKNGWSHVKVLS